MIDFPSFALAHGLLIRDLYADGRIHRCPTADHPRTRNGAYKFTGEWGFVQDWANHPEPIIYRPDSVPAEVVKRDMAALQRQDRERREQAARKAIEVVRRCQYGPHPYLALKGFPGEQGLVDTDGRLVIPMRACARYERVNSVQWIDAAGEKKFLPGGTAKGSVLILGAGADHWLAEGYATALSVRSALASLYRQAKVVVCFSAGNLTHVAGLLAGRRFVFADNDVSEAGQKAAEATGLPWVMPPEVGMDANDMLLARGVRAVATLMRSAMRGAR